jgi:1,4-alpha-glucan branching enzyme
VVVTQAHVDGSTPLGANLIADGATFCVWAPDALHVYAVLGGATAYDPDPDDELTKNPALGHWTGFVAGVQDGTRYRFWVTGPGGEGFKRDPWARELEGDDYAQRDGIVRDPDAYPWHDAGFQTMQARDLIVYQLHIGVFFAQDAQGDDLRPGRTAKLLDAVQRLPYLAELGVNAIQPLPFAEFQTPWSLGYNGTDLFSPETDYAVAPPDLSPYLDAVNALLAAKGCAPLSRATLESQVNQLKAFVDLCHLHGIAVLADVVYNHAGGELDRQSLDHFDWRLDRDQYFSGAEHAGGRVFAYHRDGVSEYLIGNARTLLREYHVDGLRFDQVTVITENGGDQFCQDLTQTLHYEKPDGVLISEYWADRAHAVTPPPQGLGFDVTYSDLLRNAVRGLLGAAAGGADAPVDLGPLRDGLQRPWGVPSAWQAYNCVENHDLIYDGDGDGHRQPRIARLADATSSRSWYARSRARVATGLLLTAPGLPMLFMGQEFLEDKLWSDDPHRASLLIWWDGVATDQAMHDHHVFTRDLIWLRRGHPALRHDPVRVYEPDNFNRVQAFQRWVPGSGRDVVVIASLSESTLYDYELGFPQPGRWLEVFNSDLYDHYPNPWVQGNGGQTAATGPPRDGMAQSARLTVPANSVLVFARDAGD